MPIAHARHGSIATMSFSSPPVNALGSRLAGELAAWINLLGREPGLSAIVLIGQGRCFCAGADVGGLDDESGQSAAIRFLMTAIDDAPIPVVAAIHGMALGGGLELALTCHARIASSDATLGFPEVKLCLLPGAGGTQRAPRLIGVKAALSLMIDGEAITAAEALKLGLIDRIADGDLLQAALGYASSLEGAPRRARDLAVDPVGAEKALAEARALTRKRADGCGRAVAAIIDCVERSLTSDFDQPLAFEQQQFEQLLASSESAGLRHAFRGERIVARSPSAWTGTAPTTITRVAIVGAGLMGSGIAMAMLAAGLCVTLIDPESRALDQARRIIEDSLRRDLEKGRTSQSGMDARRQALRLCNGVADGVADADLVIEAVFEDLSIKCEVFRAIDAAANANALLATNTSTLDVDVIANVVRDPGRVLGMHFFSPANRMRLIEVVRGQATRPDVLTTAMTFAHRIGKVGVVSGVCDGFIGNRMFEEYLRQAYFLLDEGALPQQVDRAMEAFGFAMGPFRVMDLAGQDIGWRIRQRRAVEQPERPYSKIPDRICALGRYGQKTAAGFYLYPDGRTPVIDPLVDQMVIDYSREIGISRREISDEEIVARCVCALANEGARILEEGIAWRPVDIDVVWICGYGFPRERGGPMHWADRQGLDVVLARMQSFSDGYQGWAWRPARLMLQLVDDHRSFGDLNE